MEQSASKDDNEAKYGAGLAIDMDLETTAIAKAGSDGKVWIKVKFSEVHCIHQVARYVKYTSAYYTYIWTCTGDHCEECGGKIGMSCNVFTLTVSTEETATSNPPSVSDCKYGDTVKLEIKSKHLIASELWIVEKQGTVRIKN